MRMRNLLLKIIFREINSLVKTLLSRNICQKSVENYGNLLSRFFLQKFRESNAFTKLNIKEITKELI